MCIMISLGSNLCLFVIFVCSLQGFVVCYLWFLLLSIGLLLNGLVYDVGVV